ncbi:DUF1152 domain-containing protein [Streptomyces sp. NBC_01435]|uniref:DUF1152 domain-containing protein n=1 Tax=Streptomyces sp. NBC_01435 TaxID=2903865 RepID=UPI002E334939|nr:DUF1152 domain-containing protein [Streptomyces sp. NBC_01435]
MMRLIVAAGGGGDALAAAMLHATLYGDDERAVILTYAWDRLLIDPLPGPRGADDFVGLEPLAPAVQMVSATARPIPPAGSTLPRLAAELPYTFALIDPVGGAEGIARQLVSLVDRLRPTSVDLLDVGGDVLARGDEPTLKSPLADSLTLAACSRTTLPVRLLVAGPGLDGELSYEELRGVLGSVVHTFAATDTASIDAALHWHPSEATGMLAAAARGVRGTCEIRDAGLPVPLTDASPTVHEVDLDRALRRNTLARALASTTALAEAEALSREICGFSEIDYERDKALWLKEQRAAKLDAESALPRLARFEAEARGRGVTHTTFRRLTEALNVDGSQRDDLRRLLISSRPEQFAAPLWRIPASTQ